MELVVPTLLAYLNQWKTFCMIYMTNIYEEGQIVMLFIVICPEFF